MKKKSYTKPEVNRVEIDNLFSLQNGSPPRDKPPRPTGSGSKGADSPFTSPFDDKPFS